MTRGTSSPRRRSWRLLTAGAGLLVVGACRAALVRTQPPRWSGDLAAPVLAADSASVDTVASGVLHRSYFLRRGPWAIHVLDVDRARCWSPVALKGSDTAGGRRRTSELLAAWTAAGRSGSRVAAGAVNGDFFLFAPAGVPVGALVHEGRVITGPAPRPVFATDSAGRPWVGTLRASGRVRAGGEEFPITGWNRHVPDGFALFDEHYGAQVDSATGAIRLVFETPRGGGVTHVDTTGSPTVIPRGGAVLIVGARARAELHARLLFLARTGTRFDISPRLEPLHPREAVGGFPVLVMEGREVPGLDSAGAATFAPVRHPRTIVGIAAGGRRLLLITVDGRQPGYSSGMTLREAARLALDLGATEAINLDGGGSTTMVVVRAPRGAAPARHDVVNRPSDPQGERPVGNALGIVRCER